MSITPTKGIPTPYDQLPRDPETGEVLSPGYFLERLGWSEMPETLTDEQAAQIGNVISENRARVKFFAAQAEDLGKPYAERAARWFSYFAMHLYEYAKPKLPRAGKNAKKPGEITAWNLKLPTCTIHIGNVGGIEVEDEREYQSWLRNQVALGNPLMLPIHVEYTLKADALAKYLDARATMTDAPPETMPAGVKVSPKRAVTIAKVE